MSWLPDETTFSLASRFHILSGNVDPRTTSRQLFGAIRGGFPHDLPGGLAHFARVFGENLGSADTIASRHTVLPSLLAFKSSETRTNAIEIMKNGSIGSLKATLGLLASRFGANLHLKACKSCMECDFNTVGVAYWHLQHQLPGYWHCQEHGSVLQSSVATLSGQARYRWMLPRQADLKSPFAASVHAVSESSEQFLKRLSEATSGIFSLSAHEPISLRTIALVIRKRMTDVGLASPAGRLRAGRASRQFRDQLSPLRAIHELSGIANTESIAYGHISNLLAAYEQGCHPLRVTTVIAWLFDNWSDFQNEIIALDMNFGVPTNDKKDSEASPPSAIRPDLKALILNGMSVSKAARYAGVQVVTAQSWLAQQGVDVPRRPSILRGKIRDLAIAALKRGADKAEIASSFGISPSSVNRLMRTELGLHQFWKEARHDLAQKQARTQWQLAIKKSGSVVVARTLAAGAYAWLYRNDRAWITEANKAVESVRTSNNSSVDWSQRDSQYLELAQLAVLSLREKKPKDRITIADVFRTVPGLRQKYRRIQDLPRTEKYLASVCNRHRSESMAMEDLFEN